jgi:alkanesulfonate monooxygenase SsuD/methylene tetrahydromethanopterin reductase-like flavin-dependent oxidoreductase (luciferase family)
VPQGTDAPCGPSNFGAEPIGYDASYALPFSVSKAGDQVAHISTPRIGYFLGSITGGMRDGALRWKDIAEIARFAEEVGFDSFWVPDHLLFRFEGQAPHAPWEGWSIISALAASTTRIGIGSLVVCTAFRNPGLLAKMADTVDEISGGRFALGLGAGWHEPEYTAFGYPSGNRIDRFEEAVAIIRTLLRTGHVDHQGRYYELRDCELRPRGPRPEGPPILIGALASRPRMLRLSATYADIWNGWLVPGRSYADQGAPLQLAADAACAAVGRDPGTLERTVGVLIDQRPPDARPSRQYASLSTVSLDNEQQPLMGEPEEIAAELRRFGEAGFSQVQVSAALDGMAGVEALAPVLDILRNER